MNKENASIMTYTGKMINPFYPDENSICIEDIAHSLSMQCRFNGHTNRFYSVAQHCVMAASMLRISKFPAKVQLLGLLHDSAEAYITDLPKPFKDCLDEYLDAEQTLNAAIIRKLYPYKDVSVDDIYHVAFIDKELSSLEGKEFLGGEFWENKNTFFNVDFEVIWSPGEAKKEFLNFYYSLLKEVQNG